MPTQRAPVAPARPNPTDLKRQLFVERFLIHFNATLAAKEAGYSKKTARAQGSRLLTDVDITERIAVASKARTERNEFTADRILEEVDQIATADVGDLFDFSGEAPRRRPARDIPAHARHAIASLKTRTVTRRIGRGKKARTITVTELVEYRPLDKLAALRLALLRRGLLKNEGVDVNLRFLAEVPPVAPDGSSWQQQHAPSARPK